ncbi:NACHT domain-containing protein [Streptomyces sp. NPDC002185]|uniref:NACHT domain-containing protein n=1 Tax=Streptomyces sp. NPDC002185 TaxID=3364636 RepID=UPI0036CBD036
MVQQYDYETLGPDTFQQLCQALLARSHKNVQCFPVGMPDGGRDASVPRVGAADSLVYQVKFRKPTPNKLTTPDDIVDWLIGHLKGEIPKVQRLVENGATEYIVMTNAQCSSHEEIGTRDRVQNWLDENISIPAQVWWRDDIDRRLDGEVEIKRCYGLLRDVNGLAELLGVVPAGTDTHESIRIAKTDQRISALLKYLLHQYERDRTVKFKQTELEPDLLDIFVDVPVSSREFYTDPSYSLSGAYEEAHADGTATLEMWEGLLTEQANSMLAQRTTYAGISTATLLLSEQLPQLTVREEDLARKANPAKHAKLVLEGAPGQGKSTVAQYLCQVHRARLLGLTEEIKKFPAAHVSSPNRLPLHVDLRDLATWLRKEDPFDIRSSGEPPNWRGSLEAFLAAQIRYESGGMDFTVADLDSVTSGTPILLMLDGLDEVPDLSDRTSVVASVNEAVNRISYSCPSLVTVVTSRPSVFAKTPGFSRKEYYYLSLADLSLPLVLTYTDGWLRARKVPHQEAYDIRRVLGEKLGHPHIVDLARNPMQLAILLWLVKRFTTSLPDKRTALYSEYMSTFLDREAEKSVIVRDERDLILELHGYVAWELHCQAELGNGGRIADQKLKSLLKKYLTQEGYKKPNLVDQLFAGMTQRVMVLTSRVEGTFEFEVQPLREYFAARHLYLTAYSSSPGYERKGSRSDRFEALLRNPYWWNVTRFYAGFSDKGELANIAELLEVLCEEEDFNKIAYPQEVSATLLRDQVFSQAPRSATRIFERVTSSDSLSLLLASRSDSENTAFGEDGGDVAEEMRKRIEKSIAQGVMDTISCRILSINGNRAATTEWWQGRFAAARTDHQRRQWFAMAGTLGILRHIEPSKIEELAKVPALEEGSRVWRSVLSQRIPYRDSFGSSAVEGIIKCLGEGANDVERIPMAVEGPGVFAGFLSARFLESLARTRDVPRSVSYRLHRTLADSKNMPAPFGLLARAILNLIGNLGGRTDIDAWQNAYEEISRLLGAGSRSSLRFALIGGELRIGAVSKERGGRLLDPELPIVYRARYARQRGEDEEWWNRQISDISSVLDAWFVVHAMLYWAPPSVLAKNARLLDPWVKQFRYAEMFPILTRFTRINAQSDVALPRGMSHQLQAIAATAQSSSRAMTQLESAIRKARGQHDIAALYANCKIRRISWRDADFFVSHLPDIRECLQLVSKGSHLLAIPPYGEIAFSLGDARKVLEQPSQMISSATAQADMLLTSEVIHRCRSLAETAKSEGWFDTLEYR